MPAVTLKIHNEIAQIPAAAWDALVRRRNPTISHAFLRAMEQHGCVGEGFGWLPYHLALYQEDELVAAMPLYLKSNSYGEFVFDHAWADAYQRAGLAYYPKLVTAVPYTPATGQRLLVRPGREAQLYPLLLEGAQQLAQELRVSGLHCLFPDHEQQVFLQQQGLLVRHDCHFFWQNRGYRDFADYLSCFSAKKRKNIRQERRRVMAAGVRIRCLDGGQASSEDWQRFTRFYTQIFERKWGVPTFNCGFFQAVAQAMPQQVLLLLADIEGETVAGALLYRSDDTLYGRHWGCDRRIDGLHFELCYYQGIEYAIAQGLAHFEPGVQGEHKLARGFLPTLTRSYHWIDEPAFQPPLRQFVRHEQAMIEEYLYNLQSESPFRHPPTGR